MKQFLLPLLGFAAGIFMMACGMAVSQDPVRTSKRPKPAPVGEREITIITPSLPAPNASQETGWDSSGAVSWLAQADNKYFLSTSNPQEFYVYLQVRGLETFQEKKRVPLNISLVLDRSGSMRGDKIAFARKAAAFVVEQLGQEDVLSIVNYDDRVEITSPSAPVKNKEALIKKILALQDRGSTNLTGGMLEGYTQVINTKKDGYVNRVLLMTDGLANMGITDPEQIKR
ncbi:vWA domain-containing protein [Paraflavitalea speifideaquila]|uniref:vWA domain-containing protein n=1 Tax=Paraflavitalea speifideaquila TaxID=3076558 RepID=UPI0028E1DCE4|nr:VWA domain-containing protein [Paraflavitalea speifideiaquila]